MCVEFVKGTPGTTGHAWYHGTRLHTGHRPHGRLRTHHLVTWYRANRNGPHGGAWSAEPLDSPHNTNNYTIFHVAQLPINSWSVAFCSQGPVLFIQWSSWRRRAWVWSRLLVIANSSHLWHIYVKQNVFLVLKLVTLLQVRSDTNSYNKWTERDSHNAYSKNIHVPSRQNNHTWK